MNGKKEKVFYAISTLIFIILVTISVYIRQTKKATDFTSSALQEALNWSFLSNTLFRLALIIFYIVLTYWNIKQLKKKTKKK